MNDETRWMDEGSCHGADPALFFPDRDDSPNEQYRAARAMCNGCPVRKDCLDYAVAEQTRDVTPPEWKLDPEVKAKGLEWVAAARAARLRALLDRPRKKAETDGD